MYSHTRKTRKRYQKINRSDVKFTCNLCDGIGQDQIVTSTEHCRLLRNRVPYDRWEHHKVLDHLLVVPKRHVHLLSELSQAEQLEVLRLGGEYEAKGYNVYARASNSPRRSSHHQHTHLIHIGDQTVRAGVYLQKPYLNLSV